MAAAWFTHTAFSAKTAAGKDIQKLGNLGSYLRVSYAISGTTPSFTFSVVARRQAGGVNGDRDLRRTADRDRQLAGAARRRGDRGHHSRLDHLCELRLNRELRLRAMEDRATATVSGPYAALPAGFLAMRNLQLNTSPVTALDMVSPELIDRIVGRLGTGRPRLYAIVNDEIELAPAPDGSYTAEMVYWKKLDALSRIGDHQLAAGQCARRLSVRLAGRSGRLSRRRSASGRNGRQRYQLAVQQLQNADDRSRWSAAAAAHPAEIQVT